MDNTKLDAGLWVYCIDRIWEALKAVYTGNEDVFNTTILKLSQNTQNFDPSFSDSHRPNSSLCPSMLTPNAR